MNKRIEDKNKYIEDLNIQHLESLKTLADSQNKDIETLKKQFIC